MTSPDETQEPERFVGYRAAAVYLGLQRNTLSSYQARGIGPNIDHFEYVEQYRQPIFLKTDLDKWREDRPGQGARTDLIGVAS